MQQKWFSRMVGEFLVIVLGVLVALAVDDWRQYRADRQLEAYLVGRFSDDLTADVADLRLAQISAARREWVLTALLTDLTDGVPNGRPLYGLADSIINPVQLREVMESANRTTRTLFQPWDPIHEPLFPFENSPPEFDVSDDTFREIVESGALQTLRDPALRLELLRYYRMVADSGENERREAAYHARLEEALGWVGVAVGDSLSLVALASRVSNDPRVAVVLRSALNDLETQQGIWRLIDAARVRLEGVLAQAQRVES